MLVDAEVDVCISVAWLGIALGCVRWMELWS